IAIAWSIIIGASLSFLGLGPRPPIPEWGVDLSNGRNYLLRGWWISAGPGLAIMITVVAVNLVGDKLRDVLEPRLRSLQNLWARPFPIATPPATTGSDLPRASVFVSESGWIASGARAGSGAG